MKFEINKNLFIVPYKVVHSQTNILIGVSDEDGKEGDVVYDPIEKDMFYDHNRGKKILFATYSSRTFPELNFTRLSIRKACIEFLQFFIDTRVKNLGRTYDALFDDYMKGRKAPDIETIKSIELESENGKLKMQQTHGRDFVIIKSYECEPEANSI
jgi:hypothetical protein